MMKKPKVYHFPVFQMIGHARCAEHRKACSRQKMRKSLRTRNNGKSSKMILKDYLPVCSQLSSPTSQEEVRSSTRKRMQNYSGRLHLYPAAKKVAGDDKDRGALRACTWGEKVERIIQAVIAEYENKGESMLDDAEIWVCSICGFVYIGKTPPSICPICKVPDWKFEMIS